MRVASLLLLLPLLLAACDDESPEPDARPPCPRTTCFDGDVPSVDAGPPDAT